ncbi:MAG: TauD/TfdA family dioxygenase, partial [bacterium]
GGDTLFASMYAAFEALSEPMQSFLSGLSALHASEHVYRGRYGVKEDPGRKFPEAVHPVVRTHPVTGRKGLYVNPSFTLKIQELKRRESEALLRMLYGHMAHPEFHCRFRWQKHSIALWDNRCTQHFAMWDYYPQVRHGLRVTIKGDRPF